MLGRAVAAVLLISLKEITLTLVGFLPWQWNNRMPELSLFY